jgi:uncharacterized LabA/DUF88 family protein
MAGKTAVLVDGENMLLRFEEMRAGQRACTDGLIYEAGQYVWHPQLTSFRAWDLLRVSYYTTCVGDDSKLANLSKALSGIRYEYMRPSKLFDNGYIVPRVFKKPQKSQKSASVDINIAIDLLRHAYMRSVEFFLLLTGDGDYLPLIEETMRQGAIVYVGSFSTGLHPAIPTTADEFIDLDKLFFR